MEEMVFFFFVAKAVRRSSLMLSYCLHHRYCCLPKCKLFSLISCSIAVSVWFKKYETWQVQKVLDDDSLVFPFTVGDCIANPAKAGWVRRPTSLCRILIPSLVWQWQVPPSTPPPLWSEATRGQRRDQDGLTLPWVDTSQDGIPAPDPGTLHPTPRTMTRPPPSPSSTKRKRRTASKWRSPDVGNKLRRMPASTTS